ncbi:PAS domain S-box protein [Chelatococcus sp. GCM10030263]|uniref:PAS domain S-box protein n=1 Tax=Chelatococcus sp. GCM10030263 TaxID=3273387 RepID=UPI003610817B
MTDITDSSELLPALRALLDDQVLHQPDQLLDLLPVGVYVCDRNGLIVRYNRAAAELWGRKPVIGDPAERFCGSYRLYKLGGDHVPHAECPMAAVIATGHGLRDQDVVIERPDGSRIVALVNIEPITDDAGHVVGAVNVFRDNTAQRRRLLAMEAGSPTAESILQAVPAAIYATDAAGRITFYNAAAVELWGVAPELDRSEFCGSWKLYWPDGTPLPHDECPMAMALKQKRPVFGMEAIAERPDGSRVPFAPYPMPLFGSSGELVGAVNMLVDISSRDVNSRAAYRLAAIIESSDDAILAKDLDGVITDWNQGAERLFGYTAEEIIGKPVTILVPAERHDDEPAILDRIRRGERIEHYDTIRQRKDGTLVDVSLSVSPVKNAFGTIIGASKIARDITERKRAEERQQLLLREMDHRVKNLFTLSASVVTLSARSAKTPQELANAVRERLGALARAHALTLPKILDDGRRAEPSTMLHALLRTIVSPYDEEAREDARISVSGPDIEITGTAVTSFALLLHEFTTNAAKYGALSMPTGRIKVECFEEGPCFVLKWQEQGGPPVDAETGTGSEGFGSLLARATVKGQLGGEILREWKPDGLTIRLSVTRDRLAG